MVTVARSTVEVLSIPIVTTVNLPFTEVTAESLKKVIPEKNSKILKEYELSACDPNQVLSSHM